MNTALNNFNAHTTLTPFSDLPTQRYGILEATNYETLRCATFARCNILNYRKSFIKTLDIRDHEKPWRIDIQIGIKLDL
ncbi:hypothetical protein [Roseibium algae]|uniref:Uncharacterized protein n=1 Tax=Roseibium algae TaxID=3123038 RepID=A0ABU8TI65_9HYPH